MSFIDVCLSETSKEPFILIASGLAQIAGALIERNQIERERLEIEEIRLNRTQKAMLAERLERRSH